MPEGPPKTPEASTEAKKVLKLQLAKQSVKFIVTRNPKLYLENAERLVREENVISRTINLDFTSILNASLLVRAYARFLILFVVAHKLVTTHRKVETCGEFVAYTIPEDIGCHGTCDNACVDFVRWYKQQIVCAASNWLTQLTIEKILVPPEELKTVYERKVQHMMVQHWDEWMLACQYLEHEFYDAFRVCITDGQLTAIADAHWLEATMGRVHVKFHENIAQLVGAGNTDTIRAAAPRRTAFLDFTESEELGIRIPVRPGESTASDIDSVIADNHDTLTEAERGAIAIAIEASRMTVHDLETRFQLRRFISPADKSVYYKHLPSNKIIGDVQGLLDFLWINHMKPQLDKKLVVESKEDKQPSQGGKAFEPTNPTFVYLYSWLFPLSRQPGNTTMERQLAFKHRIWNRFTPLVRVVKVTTGGSSSSTTLHFQRWKQRSSSQPKVRTVTFTQRLPYIQSMDTKKNQLTIAQWNGGADSNTKTINGDQLSLRSMRFYSRTAAGSVTRITRLLQQAQAQSEILTGEDFESQLVEDSELEQLLRAGLINKLSEDMLGKTGPSWMKTEGDHEQVGNGIAGMVKYFDLEKSKDGGFVVSWDIVDKVESLENLQELHEQYAKLRELEFQNERDTVAEALRSIDAFMKQDQYLEIAENFTAFDTMFNTLRRHALEFKSETPSIPENFSLEPLVKCVKSKLKIPSLMDVEFLASLLSNVNEFVRGDSANTELKTVAKMFIDTYNTYHGVFLACDVQPKSEKGDNKPGGGAGGAEIEGPKENKDSSGIDNKENNEDGDEDEGTNGEDNGKENKTSDIDVSAVKSALYVAEQTQLDFYHVLSTVKCNVVGSIMNKFTDMVWAVFGEARSRNLFYSATMQYYGTVMTGNMDGYDQMVNNTVFLCTQIGSQLFEQSQDNVVRTIVAAWKDRISPLSTDILDKLEQYREQFDHNHKYISTLARLVNIAIHLLVNAASSEDKGTNPNADIEHVRSLVANATYQDRTLIPRPEKDKDANADSKSRDKNKGNNTTIPLTFTKEELLAWLKDSANPSKPQQPKVSPKQGKAGQQDKKNANFDIWQALKDASLQHE